MTDNNEVKGICPAEFDRSHYYRDIDVSDTDPIIEAIEELQEDVHNIKTEDLPTLDNRINALDDSMSEALSGFSEEMTIRFGEQDTRIDAIDIRLSNLDKKRILFISDSYGHNPSYQESWIEQLGGLLSEEIEAYYHQNEGESGFGIKASGGHFFHEQLAIAKANMGDEAFYKLTDIVVAGGFNDSYLGPNPTQWTQQTYQDVRDNIGLFHDYCREYAPKARLWLFAIGWSPEYTRRAECAVLYKTVYNYARQKGFVYFDNAFNAMNSIDAFQVDNIHPNAVGSARIAESIANCLRGGQTVPRSYAPITYGFNTSQGAPYTLFQSNITGDIVTVSSTGVAMDMKAQAGTAGHYTLSSGINHLGPLAYPGCVLGTNERWTTGFTCNLRVTTEDSTEYIISGVIKFKNNNTVNSGTQVNPELLIINNGGTIENVQYLEIIEFNGSAPIWET